MSIPAIAVHGGAGKWNVSEDVKKKALTVLRRAADVAYDTLVRGGSSLDAVVEAIAILEDSEIFNAGVGSVLNAVGEVEMDAGLCTSDGVVGAVCCVKYPRNPIKLAREVALRTDHVLLCGSNADKLARALGLDPHPGPSQRVLEKFRELRSRIDSVSYWRKLRDVLPLIERGGTVGAVAVDKQGILAAGASTGGVWLKLPGRVGDSPILGAGFYASSRAAASATGLGETIVKALATLRVVNYVDHGLSVEEACRKVVGRHSKVFGRGTIGIIAVDYRGTVVAVHNTEYMPVAWRTSEKSFASFKGIQL